MTEQMCSLDTFYHKKTFHNIPEKFTKHLFAPVHGQKVDRHKTMASGVLEPIESLYKWRFFVLVNNVLFDDVDREW